MWVFLTAQRLMVSLSEPGGGGLGGHMVGRIRFVYMDRPMAGAGPTMLRAGMVVGSSDVVPQSLLVAI